MKRFAAGLALDSRPVPGNIRREKTRGTAGASSASRFTHRRQTMAQVMRANTRLRVAVLLACAALAAATLALVNPTTSNAAYNSTYYCQTAVPAHGGCGGHF